MLVAAMPDTAQEPTLQNTCMTGITPLLPMRTMQRHHCCPCEPCRVMTAQ
eukprot:CAMPEP_0202912026 /NCGR_PEP_ID=MMETSP1392-20130828/56593_1 /ASSEMBLY_ACC=CAM_ASM_000868 /TAXON_ID=225041 /ORGANISM="Chlamydomonas chlamydogama, Strain SAG 11-48b" /LENGTH=49 /DNA_ID= /DNA_START= /DNA_END= /DNA_ORIENTATION=